MSSIDASKRKALQAELNDLQSDYSRKKKEVVKQNEAEISQLKEYYDEKKEAVTEQNEAVINHIRNRQKEIAEEAIQEHHNLTDSYNARTQKLQKTYEDKLNDTRIKRQKQLTEAQLTARKKIEDIEAKSQAKLEDVRGRTTEDIRRAKERYNKDLKQISEYSEKRLEGQRQQNELLLSGEIERGRSVHERVRERNEKEIVDLQQRGEKKLTAEQIQLQKKLERLNNDSAKRYEQQQKQWASKEEHINKQYSDRIMHHKKAHENTLKTQNEHFKSIYAKNENAQKESLDIQKEIFTRQLGETRKDFVKAVSKYDGKEDDPFYKIEDRGSRLHETSDFYILKAYVPEHEKDSVKVSIHNDKATITGQRSFKDKFEDGNKTISGSSFQTFREEFVFEKPVITEGMTRERDGDWIVFQIPKGNLIRYARKA